MLDIINAIFYGIVEGITEWLPISSTGHLILYEEFFPFSLSADFFEMFRVVIQLGAIMAVVVLFFKKLNPFCRPALPDGRRGGIMLKKPTLQLWAKVLIACLPAAIIGLPLDDWLDEHLYNFYTVAATLIIYGIAFIVVELRNRNKRPAVQKLANMSYKTAALIGVFQVLSLIPGTSRSGATILGAILLGCSRPVGAEFSFFLGIPVMFGASLLKVVKFIAKGLSLSGLEIAVLLIGMIVAFFVSVLAIRFLMNFVKKHDFKVFGYYRIILGAIVLIYALCSGQLV